MDITHLTPDAEGSIEWPSFSNDKKAVVTLGAFDGMHLGHQAVIKRVVELAHQHDAFSVCLTRAPHSYTAGPPHTMAKSPRFRTWMPKH